ncbi:MAG: MG2 domain-containing protein [Verrucomicrobiota bacterium]|nr:MG2 domain-containing protein [Verrucomicrobiota bacterium]
MKRFIASAIIASAIIASALCGFAMAQNEEGDAPASNTQPDAGGIVLDPGSGELSIGEALTLTFPNPMVKPEAIDVAGAISPFVSTPQLDGDFVWKSETEGVFTVKGVVAGATHRFRLAPGLTDAAGRAIKVPTWSAAFTTPRFGISTDFESSKHLSAQPQITVTASYDVILAEVVEHAWVQDRVSRQRFPIEIIVHDNLTETKPATTNEFTVAPREPLPVGRSYDLIIDGLLDAKSRRPLPFPQVLPLGDTVPLKVEWIGGFNHALEEPQIIAKFNDEISPEEAARVKLEPAVADQKILASNDQVEIRGAFDLKQKYRVTITRELKGDRGYGLNDDSRWTASFQRKEATLIFPSSQVFMRARQELRFAFFQVNTPAVTWKLARIPLEKLAAVTARVREFERNATDPITGQSITDPRTGFARSYQTEVLVDAFALPVVASGGFDASEDDKLVRREILAKPTSDSTISGAYLLEATTKLPDGRVAGNRSIVCAGDAMFTEKRTPTKVIARLAQMSDARPLESVLVRAVTRDNIELARAMTDANGSATFTRSDLFPKGEPSAHLFIVETKSGTVIQYVDGSSFSSGDDNVSPKARARAEIITDRNLYRPAQTVKMKGIMRLPAKDGLALPDGREVHWSIAEDYGARVIAEGKATLSDTGGWEAEWKIPERVKLGRYQIHCGIGDTQYDGSNGISIEEYRVPLFSVEITAKPEIGTTAHAQVRSEYFHGAPNAGARVHWKATWMVPLDFGNSDQRRANTIAELGPRLDPDNELIKTSEGAATLDRRGRADLTCESPFKDNAAVGRANVTWRVEVTSAEAQTLVAGETTALFSSTARLGVQATEVLGKPSRVKVAVDAIDENEDAISGIKTRVDLFHITTKTAKEEIAPFVFRYRNTDLFEKVATQEIATPGEFEFPVTATGRYAAAASATALKTPLVSDVTTVSGDEPAELPVKNETTFTIEHRKQPFHPGENAVLSTQAPFAGMAWVSIETDEILDTLLVPLAGNAGRIEIPIKKEYAPNATVSVYLVKPGGDRELPRERFAFTPIEVERPERILTLTTHLDSAQVKPGASVRGHIEVKSEGKPVADADLVVFAVDDAVLQLGDWRLPDLLATFYRPNPFSVRTYEALANYVEDISKLSLTEKGFVIGDGGDEVSASVKNVRKEFRTLAFWNGSLRTDATGQVAFDFIAPDNLTAYRIVAVGETKAHQFGGDASKTVAITKPLLIEPALPRFLRDGDTVELRAVARENVADTMPVAVRCVPGDGLQLTSADTISQTLQRDTPAVFRFSAKVTDVALAPAKIRFEANSETKLNDEVEVTLPVSAPTIEHKESVAGNFAGREFVASAVMPPDWKRGVGKFTTTISTSPWLPKISGLPELLEYPHGCFEQISSRLLGYSLLANLLTYLPEAEVREADYRAVLEKGMQQFDESTLDDGELPYWPGGKSGHAFVTAQACWSLLETEKAGFHAPEGLQTKLTGALQKIVDGRITADPLTKAFALFVLTQAVPNGDYQNVSQELYLQRNQIGDEGRAFLALALHQQTIMTRETAQLLREFETPANERAFNAANFSSATRADALHVLALQTITPQAANNPRVKEMRDRLLKMMKSSAALSTQENLWTLLAFRSFLATDNASTLRSGAPVPVFSKNKRSGLWPERMLADPLTLHGLNQAALTFLLTAHYALPELDTARVDRGFRVERVVRNLTDAQRTGAADAPIKLGDQILITYRVATRKLQNYVALEDALPAGLEIINPNIAAIGKFFELPAPDAHDRVLELSYSELRDRTALLYFDYFDAGTGTYSILARATATGTFRWPATQVTPMYDSRFSGLSASSVCVVSSE